MASLDLAITGGSIWTPGGLIEEGNVLIEGEKIVDIQEGSVRVPSSRNTIDARGKTVLPGLIDTHSHHRDPGFSHKEDITTATRAAAAGGVTLSVGMPNVKPPTNTPGLYAEIIRYYSDKSITDFNHNPAPTALESVEELAGMGCLAFKFFMIVDTKRSYPHMPGLGVHDHGEILEIMEAVAKTGLPLMVHPHNQQIMKLFERRYRERGETDYRAYAKSQWEFDGILWDTAINALLLLQEVTGVRLHVLHMLTPRSIRAVREAKREGRAVTSEVNGFGLFMGDWDMIEAKGPYALGRWIPEKARAAIWEGVRDGTIDVIGTDHAPHTSEEKEPGWTDMWRAPSGAPQLQDYLSQLLTRVNQGIIPLDQAVRISSYNPAKIFGIYPRKGTIEIGSDADLVIVDMEREETIRNEDALTKCGWTPYDGQKVKGVPIHTILRGEPIMYDRKVVGKPGYGKFIEPIRQA